MSDKNNKELQDEEYKMPDEEYVAPEVNGSTESPFVDSESASPKKAGFAKYIPKVKNKRLFVIIVAVFVIVSVIHIIRSNNTGIPQVASTPKPQPSPQPAQTTVQAPPPVQVMQSPPPSPNLNMSGSLNTLQASTSQAAVKISDLESQMTDMQTSLEQTREANQMLQKTVSDLTGQVGALSKQLKDLVAGLSHTKKSISQRLVYHIRAVIPDRAWLISNRGGELTVTTGDSIKQYGIVKGIDPQQGIIYTSSGRKIYYGSNDF